MRTNDQECAICKLTDSRALVEVELAGGGVRVVLCGSHALMHQRSGTRARTVAELRGILCDRRNRDRRVKELDELAEQLTAAFAGERRRQDRRAN